MKFSYSLIKKIFPKAPPKIKLVDSLNLHSYETGNLPGDVFEVNLPPNRYSDSGSHIGIAREAAAVSGVKFKNPLKKIINPPSNKGFIKIEVRDPKSCLRYAARYFEIEKVSSSPQWMQDALLSCGIKPKNSVVDIMNYVMLETGQPLHAFDADKLGVSDSLRGGLRGKKKKFLSKTSLPRGGRGSVKIVIRRAKNGEKIETLDDQKLTLDSEVLVIADKKHPVAIAGIKGGKSSGVGVDTKRIIVEAANFDPVVTYKSAKKLKLQTDASARFCHGISPELVEWGLDRATELMLKQKVWLLDSVDYYPKRAGEEMIEFDSDKYESLVGSRVDAQKAKRYFELLGFEARPLMKNVRGKEIIASDKKFLVRVPSWRTDICGAEDLAEEVTRLEGYGKLKPKPPVLSVRPAHQEDIVTLKDKVRNILVRLQIDEVYNSSFVGDAELRGQDAGSKEKGRRSLQKSARPKFIEIENPIAEDKKYLRSSITPLLLRNVEGNTRFFSAGGGSAFGGDRIRMFEIGRIFKTANGGVDERLALGVVLAGKKDNKLILEMKGLADDLMRGLGISDFSFVVAGESLRVEADHRVLGTLEHINLNRDLVAAFGEFDLDKLADFTEEAKEFIPLKKFPAILRDMSVLVSPDIKIGDVVQEMQEANKKLVENVDLIDEYVNEKLGGKQSLTFRIIFQSDEKTLTDEEVNKEMEKITSALRSKFCAEIR